MIKEKEFQKILSWQPEKENCVLSVYLQTESAWGRREKLQTRYKALAQKLREENPHGGQILEMNLEQAWRFLEQINPIKRSIAVFCNSQEKKFWAKEMDVPVKDQMMWLERPFLLPFMEALDEYERYGVVLVDKKKARVFTYFLGHIEEETGALAWNDVRRFRSSGKDNWRSAFKLQRTAKMHEHWHLKHVAELTGKMLRARRFDRLVVGGAKQAADEFCALLKPELQLKIAGRMNFPVKGSGKKLMETLQKLMAEIERQKETEEISRLICFEAKPQRYVFGLQAALPFLSRGEVRQLIYSENFNDSNLLDDMAREVVAGGGRVEQVRGEAAGKLDGVGGIAAIMR